MKQISAKLYPKISNMTVGDLMQLDNSFILTIKTETRRGWICNIISLSIGKTKVESFIYYANKSHDEIVVDFKLITLDNAFHLVGNKSVTIENRVNKIRSHILL